MIQFPTQLDNLNNPQEADKQNSPLHTDQHANANDAIEALEAKVGADSSDVTSSHDYKIAQLESTRELSSNKENTTLDTSTTKYPTNRLVKEYADGKVTANAGITGATKTKITYDAKGLVTAGEDATTADIADSSNKRYVTDAQSNAIGTIGDKIDKSLVDAKGDIITATADNTPAKLTAGNNGEVLTADSSTATGLKYVDVASRTETLTNKRINPRLVTATSYTTDTGTSLDFSTCDEFVITAQAGDLKFNNPSGTPVNGQKIIIRVKDNGTTRNLTYDTQYRAVGVTLPPTTVVNKTTYIGGIWNSDDTKLDVVAVATEA